MERWGLCAPPLPLFTQVQSSCISINPVYKISSDTWLTHNPVNSEMATRVRTTYIECYKIVLNIRDDRHLFQMKWFSLKEEYQVQECFTHILDNC